MGSDYAGEPGGRYGGNFYPHQIGGSVTAVKPALHLQASQAVGGTVSEKPIVKFSWTPQTDSAARKRRPVVTGFLDYFPDAVSAVSFLSWAGNEKHNPNEPLHWARGKSMDTEDCLGRHLLERGGSDYIETADAIYEIPHELALAWRAMATLQLACEAHGAPKARGAK
jgi:hypothetical protein